MALQQHETVKFTEHSLRPTINTDERMTLEKSSGGLTIPVYVCDSPFIAGNDTLRRIVDSAATHAPQPLSVIIDENTHNQTPDLMWSVQAYCAHHADGMFLDTMEIASMHPDASAHLNATATVLFEAGDVVIVIGTEQLLNSVIDATLDLPEKTLIYIPTKIEDQLTLHRLLEVKQHCSVVPIISVDVLETTAARDCLAAVVKTVDLAIFQNAELLTWLEHNATNLATLTGDSLLALLQRHLAAASNKEHYLLTDDFNAVSILATTADDQLSIADAMATLVAIETRANVIAEHLPEGADTRVYNLLRTLGCNLYFDCLYDQSASLSQRLCKSKKLTLLARSGKASPSTTLSESHYKAAMAWLGKQHRHQPH